MCFCIACWYFCLILSPVKAWPSLEALFVIFFICVCKPFVWPLCCFFYSDCLTPNYPQRSLGLVVFAALRPFLKGPAPFSITIYILIMLENNCWETQGEAICCVNKLLGIMTKHCGLIAYCSLLSKCRLNVYIYYVVQRRSIFVCSRISASIRT